MNATSQTDAAQIMFGPSDLAWFARVCRCRPSQVTLRKIEDWELGLEQAEAGRELYYEGREQEWVVSHNGTPEE